MLGYFIGWESKLFYYYNETINNELHIFLIHYYNVLRLLHIIQGIFFNVG